MFQEDGDHIPDVKDRIVMATVRSDKLLNIWKATELPLKLKLRLYKAACCSILVYGSEAWILDETTCKMLNGANASILSHITGRTHHEEANRDTTTFNVVSWIRSRRQRWLGHILRLKNDERTDSRLLQQAVEQIYNHQRDGDLLMDVPTSKRRRVGKTSRK